MNRSKMIVSVAVMLGVLLVNKSYSQQYYGVNSCGSFDSCRDDFVPANYSGFDQYPSRTTYYGQNYGGQNYGGQNYGGQNYGGQNYGGTYAYLRNQQINCPQETAFANQVIANQAFGVGRTRIPRFNSNTPIRYGNLRQDFDCPDCESSINGFGQAVQNQQQNNLNFHQAMPNSGRNFADQRPQLQAPLSPSLQRKGLPQPKETLQSSSTTLIPPPQLPPQDNRTVLPQTDFSNGTVNSN